MNKRRICVVTTSRADYGLLRWLMEEVRGDEALELQVVVTGMHLAVEFGETWREIEADGFIIDRKVEMLISSDTRTAATKSIGLGTIGFAEAFDALKPDIVVVLGDRFELFCPAIASLIARIPLAHLHGGETTEGAFDESVRHAVTKMASLHFPATEEYKRRIIQLGEQPSRVFTFGAPGIDAVYRLPLLSRNELANELGMTLDEPIAIVTYHPVTLEADTAECQIENLFSAIESTDIRAVFTLANADPSGRMLNNRITEFCEAHPGRFVERKSLGQLRYLSCLKHFNVMIGNSSSGIVEAPSFHIPVVNIGDRQRGRVRAANIIDTSTAREDIVQGIKQALSPSFRLDIGHCSNPYDPSGDGFVSRRIKNVLRSVEIDEDFFKTRFNDVASMSI